MTPTAKLRFFEKTIHFNSGSTVNDGIPIVGSQKFRILQQWWAPFRTFSDGYGYQTVEQEGGEWRDVPLETEE